MTKHIQEIDARSNACKAAGLPMEFHKHHQEDLEIYYQKPIAALMAHAPEDIPVLLEALTAAQAELKRCTTGNGTYISMGAYEKLQADYDRLNDFEQSQCAKLLDQLAASRARVRAATERLCYSCRNNNPASEIKHSTSCDVCPWRGPQDGKGEAE